MKYDFTTIPDRSGTGSAKWNNTPNASVERVPLTTADMEFVHPPQIVKGLQEHAATAIFGYTDGTKAYYDAVCNWMERRHDFHVEREWIVSVPGIVYALGMLTEALTKKGDSVILMPPVYYPFESAVLIHDRRPVYNSLIQDENGRYVIDYEDLEEKASREDCKLLIFCSPHNPVGRVWEADELERVVDICARHGVIIVDDEIHHDLIMPGYKHTVMINSSPKAKDICVVCTAPSKSFNLAGLECSNLIIPNPAIRTRVAFTHKANLITHLNVFAYKGCEIAYNECEDWLEELIEVIAGNAAYITDFMAKNFPEVKVFPLEGTYLLWLDMRALGMTHRELEELLKEDAQLYLDEGYLFGAEGRGYERINLACARLTLERSMERFKAAVDKKREQWLTQAPLAHKKLSAGDIMEGFVYDTGCESEVSLAKKITRTTMIVFSRYYSCSICRGILDRLKELMPRFEENDMDVKVVMQSDVETLWKAQSQYPFELISDADALLYDRYEVYDADSDVESVAGDLEMALSMGGAVEIMKNSMIGGGGQGKTEGRKRQLPAIFIVEPDMSVSYAYYGRYMRDLPKFEEILDDF